MEHSCVLEIKPEVEMFVHVSYLKHYKEDSCLGNPVPLFYHRRTVVDPDAEPDEWLVEKVVKHRVTKSGKFEFLVRWQCYVSEEDTLEPVKKFIHKYSSDLVQYCLHHKLPIIFWRIYHLHPISWRILGHFLRRSLPLEAGSA